MNNIYFAVEAMGTLFVLLLVYANLFEVKQSSNKKNIFTRLLIANVVVIMADAISWLDLNWESHYVLFFILIAITYFVPFFMLATFSKYIYVHISEREETSQKPFKILFYSSVIAGTVCFLLCITGKLFVIENGNFYPGELENAYYIFYVIALLFIVYILFNNRDKLGLHDMFGAMSFGILPAIAMAISLSGLEINLVVPSMSVDMLILYIFLQSESESRLLFQSNNDELTGLYNRRSYEDDMLHYPDVPVEPDFVYASIDINGLKQVNDTLGHAAGDELICGVAYCLKRTLGNYGKVYRTGGDEFVSMFFADEEKCKFLMDDLDMVVSQWKGNLVESLSVSIGYATKREFKTETVKEMAEISDKRMYEDKDRYYQNHGIDRRRRMTAQSALCKLYTKILKIDLTKDTYTIVSMDTSEQTSEKGFSLTISEWFTNFAMSGQVHEADVETYLQKTDLDYLKAYFKEGHSSFSIFYRRKYEDSFKHVSMEMIPADDYTSDNQTLFLYVKSMEI